VAEIKQDGTAIQMAEKEERREAECRSCKAPCYWVKMASGSNMLVNRGREARVCFVDGQWRTLGAYTSHFATCPDAKSWRKAGG
jgi:hypothetical protein